MKPVTRESSVQGISQENQRRDNLLGILMASKSSCKKELKEQTKMEKKELKQEKKEEKMSKAEAEQKGFFKGAKALGWGLYQVSDLDGGLGGVWYLEKDADGNEFIVKQTDPAGEVVRRVKTASLNKKSVSEDAQQWISNKIKILRDEGKDADQSSAIAYSMAREKGFDVPEKK